MEYEKLYKEALERAKIWQDHLNESGDKDYADELNYIFPELQESEGDRTRKELIGFLEELSKLGKNTNFDRWKTSDCANWIAWLEKQETVDENEVANCVLNEVANSIMRWLDSNCAEGNMCLSGTECEDIENAVRNANWQKIYGYMKKKLEKQGEKKSSDEVLKIRQELYQSGYNDGYKHGIEDGKQAEQKPFDYENANIQQKDFAPVEPKFKVGDEIRIKTPSSFDKDMEVARIEKDYYLCNHIGKFSSEVVPFSKESSYELIEQKPANKVEPKFHEGDWIISNNKKSTYQVIEVKRGIYVLRDNADNHEYHIGIEEAEKSGRLWTIQDAKDGDVLCCENGWTCIFKTLVNDENFSSYCFMDSTKWFCETGSECHTLNEEFTKAYNGEIKPATKEQRELLFQKIREAGYMWDEEMKELKHDESK